MSADPDCVFCRIVAGRAEAERLFEDDLTVAFMDVSPVSDGHALVVPKEHFVDAFDLAQPYADAVWRSTLRVASAVRGALGPDGLNIHQSNGRAANQHVFHFHLHVIPRYADGRSGQRSGIRETAERIRASLGERR